MDTFGSWIQKLRKESEIDLRTLGLLSGIHFTTIGRLEKGQNEPTLDTVVRITKALNGNQSELYKLLTGKDPISPTNNLEKTHLEPTPEDVLLFESLIQEKPKTIGDFCANIINKISGFSDKSEQAIAMNLHEEKINDEQKWLYDSLKKPNYTAIEIFKYFLELPGQNVTKIITPQFNYPQTFDYELILNVYLNNGVIITEDVKRFISDYYHDYYYDPTSTNNIQTYKRIEQQYSRLLEQNLISELKLSDILLFDQVLVQKGEIFMLAWDAAIEEIRVSNLPNRISNGKLLIYLGRYLSTFNYPFPDWLNQLQKIGQ